MRQFNSLKPFLAAGRLRRNHSEAIDAAGPVASLLKSRSVIRFAGPDTIKFLQGLVTNDVRRFGESSPHERSSTIPTPNMPVASEPPMYAALLTSQGRFLYDFFLYRPAKQGDKLDPTGSGPGSEPGGSLELFADVDASVLDELLQTLKKYRLRAKVEIENVGDDFRCWQRFGGDIGKKSSKVEEPEAASVGWGSGVDRAGMSASHGTGNGGWQWFKDPRLECLGLRGIFPADTTPPLVEADKETNEENYLLWRVKQGVAEGSSEIRKGEAIPLEYNLVGLNAISFEKGCYVGQELIARTHHRGVIRKRLVPLKFVDEVGKEVEQQVAPGSQVIDAAAGKKIGSVTTAIGHRGLGVLRVDDAFGESCSLAVEGLENVKVEALKPKWWPREWFPEHHRQSAVA